MTTGPPTSPQNRDLGALPDLSTDVVTRLVVGRCYPTELSLADYRDLLAAAQERGLTVVPAGCEANLADQQPDFTVRGPMVIGRQAVWTSASVGPSEPFEADEVDGLPQEAASSFDARFEQELLQRSGAVSAVEEGVFLCNTGPLASGRLVFGIAGTREEAELTGAEYVWGEDMQKLAHQDGIIGEVIARAEGGQVEQVDLSNEADHMRREDAVPYADEPTYFLVAHYD